MGKSELKTSLPWNKYTSMEYIKYAPLEVPPRVMTVAFWLALPSRPTATPTKHLEGCKVLYWPGEGIEEPSALGVGEGDAHARHERRVQHHGAHLVARRQVHGGHGADALPVQDDVLRADPVAGAQRRPRRVDVRVQILLRRLPAADAVPGVVVTEYITIYPSA